MGTQGRLQAHGHGQRPTAPQPDPDPVVREIPVFLTKSILKAQIPSGDVTSNRSPIRTYLVQYPLEPRENPTNSSQPLDSTSSSGPSKIAGIKFKPNQEKLQVTRSIDTQIGYDSGREKLLRNRKRSINNQSQSEESGSGDEQDLNLIAESDPELPKTQILESLPVPRCADGSRISKRFALGWTCKQTGTFQICPITSVLQLKPKFPQLEVEPEDSDEMFSGTRRNSEDGSEPGPTKVTVRFTQSRDRWSWSGSGINRQPKYDAWRRRKEEEPWLELDYFDDSDKDKAPNQQIQNQSKNSRKVSELPSQSQDLKPVAPETDTEVSGSAEIPNAKLTNSAYLNLLIPKTKELMIDDLVVAETPRQGPSSAAGPSPDGSDQSQGQGPTAHRPETYAEISRISMQSLKSFPFPEQLRILFLKGQIFQYSQLVSLLRTKLGVEMDDLSLLKAVQSVGVLVQGCWIVKSDLLFPKDVHLQRARDLILHQFTLARSHTRSKLCHLAHIPPDTLTSILTPFAKPSTNTIAIARANTSGNSGKNPAKSPWEFSLPFDSEFVRQYPDIQTRQRLMWDIKNSNRIRRESEHFQQVERAEQQQQQQAAQKSKKQGRGQGQFGPGTSTRRRKSRSRNVSFSSTVSSGSAASTASVPVAGAKRRSKSESKNPGK